MLKLFFYTSLVNKFNPSYRKRSHHNMRILFISAFYPPHFVGGWEQLVQDINLRLQARGHTTQILTSNYGIGPARVSESGVERVLDLESDLNHYRPWQFFGQRQQRNLRQTQHVINTFKPEVIFVHVMWNLWRGIPWLAEKLCPGRVVYYMADDWPYVPDIHTAYWQDPAQNPLLKLPKELLAKIALKIIAQENRRHPLQFEHVLCVSQSIKDNLARFAGITPESLCVVYNGIDLDHFKPPLLEGDLKNGQGLSLLYAGSLVPHKGVHTAVEAMAILAQKTQGCPITLTIIGAGHPEYEAQLKEIVRREGLERSVRFRGRVPREEMPALLQKFDGLVFPSIWEEPLARMTQEAMATGLVVVGTTTGGTKEILVEGETGLTFAPEDAAGLARRIEELSQNPELMARLAANARNLVIHKFDIRRMIDEIEEYLAQVLSKIPDPIPINSIPPESA
jgi:glycogen synthase